MVVLLMGSYGDANEAGRGIERVYSVTQIGYGQIYQHLSHDAYGFGETKGDVFRHRFSRACKAFNPIVKGGAIL